MNFFIETIGCQMNVNDSNDISEYLVSFGCKKIDDYLKADIVLLNT